MKGILLAGGSGSRLYPLTNAVSKQILPIYDKPMIYYPLSVLMLAGIKEILIISTPQDLPLFQELLADGRQIGLQLSYIEQPRPEGLAQAFCLGKEFIGSSTVCLVLGDNLIYGQGLSPLLKGCAALQKGGIIFGYPVKDPTSYGVVEFSSAGKALRIVEKPLQPISKYAVPGIYFYDQQVVSIAEDLTPSDRGELEITDINNAYLQKEELYVECLGRGYAWLDAGTHESLHQASSFVQAIQERQGFKIGCIEEIAYRQGFINAQKLRKLAEGVKNNYGKYLLEVLEE